MGRYIVSIEVLDRAIVHHHVIAERDSFLFTLHTRRLYNPRDNQFVIREILHGSLANVVLFYKERYQMHHQDISLSFGPMLRQMIKDNKKVRNPKRAERRKR